MDERRLAQVLAEFARTLTTDFSIQKILDHIAYNIVEVVPVTGAGVLLMDNAHEHHFVAASDDVILRIEGLQMQLGEGPCMRAYESGEQVAVPDLSRDTEFPRFSRRAVDAGLAAVYSFPLRLDEHQLGALELYCATPTALTPADLSAAQTLADVTAAYLFNAQARDEADSMTRHLQLRALHDPLTGLAARDRTPRS